MTTPHESDPKSEPNATARELLVSRIVDGAATPDDWTSLRTLASGEPDVWQELAETQAQNEQLISAVGEAIGACDVVDLPDATPVYPEATGIGRRMEFVRSWGGWAAAAAVLLVWWTGVPVTTPGGSNLGGSGSLSGASTAGTVGPRIVAEPGSQTSFQAADEALERYLQLGRDEGTVVASMPDQVVEARPLEDGTAEVLYLRQILERRIVDQFFRLGSNEHGDPIVLEGAAPSPSSPF
ncbi:MAG: hypothetical protein AAGI53_02765 [Planctomycetota bacterium]